MFKNQLYYGIPDYLNNGTFLVLRPILYSNSKSNSNDVLDKMIKEATKNKEQIKQDKPSHLPHLSRTARRPAA